MLNKILIQYKQFLKSTFKNDFQSLHRKIKYEIQYEKFNELAIRSEDNGVTDKKYTENKLIVSLTSFSTRINYVHITIESLLNQTIPPNKIILWLNKPFDHVNIPEVLKKQLNRGLEINFVEDFKSYDKLIHALKDFPNDTIITCDDDMIYPYDFIERMLKCHIEDPKSIFFFRGHKMKTDNQGVILPYKKWDIDGATTYNNIFNFPTGNAGILYPKNAFSDEVFNFKKFKELAPNADDVWFRAMSILNGTTCRKINLELHPFEKMLAIGQSQHIALWKENIDLSANDVQIKNVFKEYSIYDILKKQ